ncbi:MAG: hypothetical protein ACF788_14005 [Novipirellula sp. JB048]
MNREDKPLSKNSPHPLGCNVGFRGAAVMFISETIERSQLQGLLGGTMEARDW